MDFRFYLKLFLRRLPYFLLFLIVGTAAGLTVATVLPPVYTAKSVLVVEPEQIPSDLAQSTVQTGTDQALQIIRQRILTRPILLDMADEFGIYSVPGSPDRSRMTADDVVSDLRRRILIDTSGAASRRGNEANIVTVSFEAPTAQLSAAVVNNIVTMILDENVSLRRGASGQTLEFFKEEVARLDRDLAERSAEILAFKEENLDSLPDSLDFRRSQQAAAQERLQQLAREETVLRDRRNRLVTLYETSGDVPIAAPNGPRTPEEAQLADMRRELSLARAVMSPENPQRKVLEARVKAMEELVASQQASGPVDSGSGGPSNAQLTAYQIQLADIDGQLDFIDEQKKQLRDQMAALDASIAATPGNAIALETMERDYAAVRTRYEEAVADLARAQTGDTIETLSKGQRIAVIEPAIAPAAPDSPNRKLIAAGGVGLGAAFGLGLVVLLELLNSSVRRPADLRNSLGIEPFGTLPLIRTPGDIRLRRAKIILAFIAVAVVVPAGLWWVHTEITPLDVLIDRALDEFGVAGLAAPFPVRPV